MQMLRKKYSQTVEDVMFEVEKLAEVKQLNDLGLYDRVRFELQTHLGTLNCAPLNRGTLYSDLYDDFRQRITEYLECENEEDEILYCILDEVVSSWILYILSLLHSNFVGYNAGNVMKDVISLYESYYSEEDDDCYGDHLWDYD